MTRIVAGAVEGRTIKVLASGMYPTSECVCEAFFSRPDHLGYVEGRAVLDLYSGSGALGLEAASRSAAFIECAESSCRVAEFTRTNARTLNLRARVNCMWAELRLVNPSQTAFDAVFLNLPYNLDEEHFTTILARLPSILALDGVAVVERSSRSPEPSWPSGSATTDERVFEDVCIFNVSPVRPDT